MFFLTASFSAGRYEFFVWQVGHITGPALPKCMSAHTLHLKKLLAIDTTSRFCMYKRYINDTVRGLLSQQGSDKYLLDAINNINL
jgi:hypothetical protein